jgi:hypothetical protein
MTPMSDPRTEVESLTYRHSLSSDARQFPPGYCQVVHLHDFHCVVDAEKLVARPIRSFGSLEAAMSALETHLRSWELRYGLLRNTSLRFEKSGHVMRSGQEGVVLGSAAAVGIGKVEARGIVILNRVEIPEGPTLEVTEEVQSLQHRWSDVVAGRERLLVGANWVLTDVQRYYEGRDQAAAELRVSKALLNTLGRLCVRNDPDHGRTAKHDPEPLSPEEVAWIRAFVPRLILRVAEVESGVEGLSQITMDIVPPLARETT